MGKVITFSARRRNPEHESLRRHLHDVIERALALLDCLDGDPDLEGGGDDEASLGSPAGGDSERHATKARIKERRRRTDRLFHSAVSHLEQALGVSAECVGRDMLVPECLDWHKQAMAMLAERLAAESKA